MTLENEVENLQWSVTVLEGFVARHNNEMDYGKITLSDVIEFAKVTAVRELESTLHHKSEELMETISQALS